MRTLGEILGMELPDEHQAAMANPLDPIHAACDFLLVDTPYKLLNIVERHHSLHDSSELDSWPNFLVAFASNGCGDYFAYDLRHQPPSIIYIDPDSTVQE